MAGIRGRGGQNRLSIAEHERRGTLRPGRHLSAVTRPPAPAASAETAAAQKDLSPAARRLFDQVLAQFAGWDAAGLRTLRSYVLSSERLHTLETEGATTPALEREIKCNLQLLRSLNLEAAR